MFASLMVLQGVKASSYQDSGNLSATVQLQGSQELDRYLMGEIWRFASRIGSDPDVSARRRGQPYFDVGWLRKTPQLVNIDTDPSYDQLFYFHQEVRQAIDRFYFLAYKPNLTLTSNFDETTEFHSIWTAPPRTNQLFFAAHFPEEYRQPYENLWAWLNLLDLSCELILHPPIEDFHSENFETLVEKSANQSEQEFDLSQSSSSISFQNRSTNRLALAAIESMNETVTLFQDFISQISRIDHPLFLSRPELSVLLKALEQSPAHYTPIIEDFIENITHREEIPALLDDSSSGRVMPHPRINQFQSRRVEEQMKQIRQPLLDVFAKKVKVPLLEGIGSLQSRIGQIEGNHFPSPSSGPPSTGGCLKLIISNPIFE